MLLLHMVAYLSHPDNFRSLRDQIVRSSLTRALDASNLWPVAHVLSESNKNASTAYSMIT